MPERGGLAFWIHQLVEYLLGVLVILEAVHVDKPIVPVVVGGLVIAAAATADGPLAAARLVPRAVHRILDIVLAVAILALTVLFHAQMGEFGIAFSVIAAAGTGRSRAADRLSNSSAPTEPFGGTARSAIAVQGRGRGARRRPAGGSRDQGVPRPEAVRVTPAAPGVRAPRNRRRGRARASP